MVEYTYDAWGNHIVTPTDEAYTELSQLNPFRYRGYYYDTETGLYFLKTRYYDPEVGRFITIDDLSYLDPDTINGLNLYAYCGDNPVMMTDEDGTMPNWLKWLIGGIAFVGAVVLTALTGGAIAPLVIGMATSILTSGVIQGCISVANGGSFSEGFWDGAADGALWGGLFALGGAAIRTAKIFKNGVVVGESMGRVGKMASEIGAATYKSPFKTVVELFGGKNATNIGFDFTRTTGMSIFYGMERGIFANTKYVINYLMKF